MTIKASKKTLEAKCDQQGIEFEEETDIELIRGKIIAVDISIKFYKWNYGVKLQLSKSSDDLLHNLPTKIEVNRRTLEQAINFVKRILLRGAIPLLIFDGPANKLKEKTKEDRQKIKQTRLEEFEDIRKKLLAMTYQEVKKNKKMFEEYKKKWCGLSDFGHQEFDLCIKLMKEFGIPCIKSKEESDGLCASLCKEGYADAVFSEDSDMYAYLCPLIITKINQTTFGYIQILRVIEELGIDKRKFVDFCITCGCDYNNNIRNFGAGKAYKWYFTEGKTYSDLEDEKDTEILNYKECKKIFKRAQVENYVNGKFDENDLLLDKDPQIDGTCAITTYKFQSHLKEFQSIYKRIPGLRFKNQKTDLEKLAEQL